MRAAAGYVSEPFLSHDRRSSVRSQVAEAKLWGKRATMRRRLTSYRRQRHGDLHLGRLIETLAFCQLAVSPNRVGHRSG